MKYMWHESKGEPLGGGRGIANGEGCHGMGAH